MDRNKLIQQLREDAELPLEKLIVKETPSGLGIGVTLLYAFAELFNRVEELQFEIDRLRHDLGSEDE